MGKRHRTRRRMLHRLYRKVCTDNLFAEGLPLSPLTTALFRSLSYVDPYGGRAEWEGAFHERSCLAIIRRYSNVAWNRLHRYRRQATERKIRDACLPGA